MKRWWKRVMYAWLPAAAVLLGGAGGGDRVELYRDEVRLKSLDAFQVIDDTVFLPLSETTSALGIKGYSDLKTKTVFLQCGDDVVVVSTERRSVRSGSVETPLRFTPIWTKGEVYVPHQVFTEVVAGVIGSVIRVGHPAIGGPGPAAGAGPVTGGREREAPGGTAGSSRDLVDLIVLDPGHGGHDSGARGPSGLLEKDVVLAIAKKLRDRLEGEAGVTVALTREDDVFIPLAERPARARELGADLFVSLHANGYKYISAQGFETFFASLNASDQASLDLAEFENREAGGEATPAPVLSDLEQILGNMAQTEHLSDSQHLAELIQGEMAGVVNSENRGVKQAPFRVLMDSTTPAVLVEVGFITSPAEAMVISDPVMQDRIVEALARAVLGYRDETNQRRGLKTKEQADASR